MTDWCVRELACDVDACIEKLLAAEPRIQHSLGIHAHNPLPDNLTWHCTRYNIFSHLACHQCYYDLWWSLLHEIAEYTSEQGIDTGSQLWMQSWANIHRGNERLLDHQHQWPIHGYISLDPGDSETVFLDAPGGTELYRIHNRPGTVYIGPGERYHRVEYLTAHTSPRITLGWDLEYRERIIDETSFFPIVLPA